MTTTVEIPGGTAVLREPHEMRGRDRNLIKAAAMAASSAIAKMPADVQEGKREGESDEDAALRLSARTAELHLTRQEAAALLELREAAMIASLVSWTRDEPLPTMDTLGDLPGDLYDALDAAIGGAAGALSAATPDFSPTSKMDEEVPTGSSGSSDGPSTADPESPSIPTLPSDGESTATESSTPA